MIRGLKVGRFLLDIPRIYLADLTSEPYRHIVFLIMLTFGASHFWAVFPEDMSTILKDLSFEIAVVFLLGILVLYRRYPHLLQVDITPPKWLRDSRLRQRAYKLLPFIMVGLILVFALVLRLINLDRLDPYTDENAHLINARNFQIGHPVDYHRAPTISYIVYLFWEIVQPANFLEYIYWARVPGVIFGALTVIPLFFLARRISSAVGITACILWAVSPWAIGVAKYVREYTYFPFFILIVLIAFLNLFDIWQSGYRKKLRAFIIYATILAIFAVYALAIDSKSTVRVGFLVLAGAFLGRFGEAILKSITSGSIRRARFFSIGALLLAVVVFLVLKHFSISAFGYQMDRRYFRVFLSAASYIPTMWWSGYTIMDSVMSLFIFSGCIVAAMRKDYNYFYFLSIFVLMLFFFYLFFDRYFKPRYCFYVLPIFTIVIAAGIYSILDLAKVFRNVLARAVGVGIALFFVLSIFNYRNTQKAITPILTNPVEKKKYPVRRTGYSNITGEYHQDMRRVGGFLKRRIKDNDVFITTIFQPILALGLNIPPERMVYYNYKNENLVEQVKNIMNKHEQGWLILDYRRNGKITKRKFGNKVNKPFKLGRNTMTLVSDRNEAQIFRWTRKKESQ